MALRFMLKEVILLRGDDIISVRLDHGLLKKIDWEVQRSNGRFLSRSHFIRVAVLKYLKEELKNNG